MPSQLTVVTGPADTDIGAVAAVLGRHLDDGLAVRVVDSHRTGNGEHISPDPFHGVDATVRLRYLPSAWQDPQTNLGVVFTGHAHSALMDDIHTLDALGLDPSHRLTVQSLGGRLRHDYTFPAPIEVGDVGVHARDAVLRAGGYVLAEAGHGMTHLEALAALRLPPWASWIDTLTLWSVFDVADMIRRTSPGERLEARDVALRVLDGLTELGATTYDDGPVTSHVAILGLQEHLTHVVPGKVSLEIFARAGGVGSVNFTLDAVAHGIANDN